MTAHATPSDPGKTAIDFLEKVRLRQLDLAPGADTALSAQTADEKKRQISRRLDRMARDLGDSPLEVGEVKQDDDFAAVLVRKTGDFDPARLQVFPVALVKRGAQWAAAPVPASFENVGAGYAIALRKRIEILESWMLREQVVDLERLRQQSVDRIHQKIGAKLSAETLRGLDLTQIGEKFIAACEQRDLPTILGFLGGLATPLPDDWPARLRAAEKATTGSPPTPAWRLLTDPQVARVRVCRDASHESSRLYLACLDPTSSRIEVLHVDLSRASDGLWQVELPPPFFQLTSEPDETPQAHADADLRNAFPEHWRKAHPLAPQTTAELIQRALMTGLNEGDPRSILSICMLDQGPEPAAKACVEAAQLWQQLHDPGTLRRAVPLAFKANEAAAVGVFQFVSARDPDRFDPKIFYFQNSPGGWLWTPHPAAATREDLQAWADSEAESWSHKWQQKLLTNSPVINSLHSAPSPAKDAARQCVEAWFDTTRRGDFTAAITLTARLAGPQSGSAMLQNLGFEIIDSQRGKITPQINGIYQGKTWTAVGVEINRGDKSVYPLYPVIQTDQGPRIVIEIDLFASGNRGREFLNKAAFERLQKFNVAADELKSLFAQHQANIEGMTGKASHR